MPDDVVNIIIAKLDKLEDKIDRILEHGCSRAETHIDVEKRLRSLETDRAKAMGAIVSISGIIGFLGSWIGKKLGF